MSITSRSSYFIARIVILYVALQGFTSVSNAEMVIGYTLWQENEISQMPCKASLEIFPRLLFLEINMLILLISAALFILISIEDQPKLMQSLHRVVVLYSV